MEIEAHGQPAQTLTGAHGGGHDWSSTWRESHGSQYRFKSKLQSQGVFLNDFAPVSVRLLESSLGFSDQTGAQGTRRIAHPSQCPQKARYAEATASRAEQYPATAADMPKSSTEEEDRREASSGQQSPIDNPKAYWESKEKSDRKAVSTPPSQAR